MFISPHTRAFSFFFSLNIKNFFYHFCPLTSTHFLLYTHTHTASSLTRKLCTFFLSCLSFPSHYLLSVCLCFSHVAINESFIWPPCYKIQSLLEYIAHGFRLALCVELLLYQYSEELARGWAALGQFFFFSFFLFCYFYDDFFIFIFHTPFIALPLSCHNYVASLKRLRGL